MFEKSLEEIFIKNKLLLQLENFRKAKDYFEVKKEIKTSKLLNELLHLNFTPTPIKSITIPKNNNEKREIAISSTKSKVIQKVLIEEIEYSVKFSDKSYAYRKNKGTLKAINRVKDFLKRYEFISKVDIESFFDTIDSEILTVKLNEFIKDKRVIELILTFVNNGALKGINWVDKDVGIYQGDNISPFLSNLYLDGFDKFLESKNIDFVRFGDDIILFSKSFKDSKTNTKEAEEFLKSLKLKFNNQKRYLSSIRNGFEYLGLYFQNDKIVIETSRFDKKILAIREKVERLSLIDTIYKLNEHILGVKRYYKKVITLNFQIDILQKELNEILIEKIIYEKEQKITTSKKEFFEKLKRLESYEDSNSDRVINELIDRAYSQISKPLDSAKTKIEKSKKSYEKSLIKSSEIVLSKFGLSLGVAKGKFIIKEKARVIKSMPSNYVTRVIILSKGVNLSSNVIEFCADKKISIDFISKSTPYAMITYYNSINNELYLKQLEVKNSSISLELAKEFLKAKSKNQINLIKYFAKSREDEGFEDLIENMEELHKKLNSAKDRAELMG